MASISASKWAVMISLALISGFLGALPYLLLRMLKGMHNIFNHSIYHLILTVLACGGGGVLLATTVLHMLPENRIHFEANEVIHETVNSHLPIAEIVTIAGFLLIYFLEEAAHAIYEATSSKSSQKCQHGHSHGHAHAQKEFNEESSNNSTTQLAMPDDSDSISPGKANLFASLIALIALSFHAIMEGIAIGIQDQSVWLMFVAIASHKFLISFCMGMEMCASKVKPKIYFWSISIFALLSPLGILIGSVISAETSTNSLPLCILEGFATGTLLYVVFFEILSRERERRNNVLASRRMAGLLQFFGVVVGVVAVTLLLTLVSHDHATEDEHAGEDHEHEDVHEHLIVA